MTAAGVGSAGNHRDVVVIGSGPGGATAAATLAETGTRNVPIERGDCLRREPDNWDSKCRLRANPRECGRVTWLHFTGEVTSAQLSASNN